MSEMLIGEVAQKTGLAPSTIRYYESIGLLPIPRRVNGRRRFNEEVIQQLTVIQAAQNARWSLAEIKELLHGFPNHASLMMRWKERAPKKIRELDAIIEQTQRLKQTLEESMGCTCKDLDECTLASFN